MDGRSSCCLCRVCFDSPNLKGKGKEKIYTGSSCATERKILEKFVDTHKLPRSLLPTDGKLCYCCLMNLKNWNKKIEEIASIQEQIKTHLQQESFLQRSNRSKRTLSDVDREESAELLKQSNCTSETSAEIQVGATLDPSEPEGSGANNADDSFEVDVDVTIKYKTGSRVLEMTPSRKEPVKKMANKSYPSLASSIVNSHTDEALKAVGKKIQEEIAFICSDKTNSILKGDKKNIVNFSWHKVFADLKYHTPSLVKLLQMINPKAANNHMLISVLIAMMVKCRNDKLSLVQRVFSVFLYGSAVHKEVYKLLQPFMLCMCHKSTLNVIDDLVEDYDASPQTWRDKLTQLLPDDFEANPDDLDYDNNSGLGSAIMSVLGWVSQEDEAADVNVEMGDGMDEAFSSWTLHSDEDGGSNNNDGSDTDGDTESEYDYNVTIEENISSTGNDGSLDISSCPTIENHVLGMESHPGSPLNPISNEDSSTVCSSSTNGSCMGNNESEPVHEDSAVANTATTSSTNGSDVGNNEPEQVQQTSSDWHGFKLVGDNIDKNIRPSFSRSDKSTQSLHCFHYYAVLDRVNLSLFSDATPNMEVDVDKLLINQEDIAQLQSDAITLISRILVRHLPQFSSQAQQVQSHIKCKYEKEMSSKSNVVPLGIIDKNENRVDEMCHIMDKLHTLVPGKTTINHFTLPDEESEAILGETFHQLLLGGDQLTAARCRGSAAARCDMDTKTSRLYGLVPVSEDWHSKLCLCKVIYRKLFDSSLLQEKGSLPQLKVLVNFAAKVDPEKCMKGCEDFFLMALHAHVVAAAKEILLATPYESVESLAKEIVVQFITFEPDINMRVTDKVYLYALQVLNLMLLWHGFDDGIREGDGDRILTYYKFILNVFKVGRCYNYCKEVVILLTQYHCLFSERQAAQLKWSRCINTKGYRGCNVSCDLHLEHLNRRLKGMIRGLHSNVTQKALCRAAQSVGIVHQVCGNITSQTEIYQESGRHTRPEFNKECAKMVEQLQERRVFTDLGRKPAAYKRIKSVLQQHSKKDIKAWIIEKYGTYKM